MPRVPDDLAQKALKIAQGPNAALQEVARVTALLGQIDGAFRVSPSLWNIRYVMNGYVAYGPNLHGCQLYRVCPGHQYCIAILVESGGKLEILDFCSSADLPTVETVLSQSWTP
jgi:hypothetical protein